MTRTSARFSRALTMEGFRHVPALEHDVSSHFCHFRQFEHLEQAVFHHGIGKPGTDVRNRCVFPQRLFDPGIHEHGAPGAQITGRMPLPWPVRQTVLTRYPKEPAKVSINDPHPDEQASLSSMRQMAPFWIKMAFMSWPPMSRTNDTSGSMYFAASKWAMVSTSPMSIPNAVRIRSSPYPVTAVFAMVRCRGGEPGSHLRRAVSPRTTAWMGLPPLFRYQENNTWFLRAQGNEFWWWWTRNPPPENSVSAGIFGQGRPENLYLPPVLFPVGSGLFSGGEQGRQAVIPDLGPGLFPGHGFQQVRHRTRQVSCRLLTMAAPMAGSRAGSSGVTRSSGRQVQGPAETR